MDAALRTSSRARRAASALAVGMPEWMPNARASYVAASTTPRSRPATTIGRAKPINRVTVY